MHWGSQNDCREIRGGASSDIGYFKKAASYVTKDVCEERPKGESRNRKHLMMLDMAARAMCCDKCIEKARSCFGAGTPNFTGKRMAMEKIKFNARQESRLEFPLRVCLEDFEGASCKGPLLSLGFRQLSEMRFASASSMGELALELCLYQDQRKNVWVGL